MIRRSLHVLLLAIALFGGASASAKIRSVRVEPYSVIRIGALFSLTGDGASLGTASAAALELAVRDIITRWI